LKVVRHFMKKFIQFFAFIIFMSCDSTNSQDIDNQADKDKQEQIIEEYLKKGAWNFPLFSNDWQEEIDKGLAKDSTIAYLWQQKAMPLFKQSKYEVGMKYIDKAVKYDAERWQDYRAFIKCIFAKTYTQAIDDFEDYKSKFGNGYVMDHSYDFYIGLSYLQLNEYTLAENSFTNSINQQISENGESWIHYLDIFYLAITQMEQKQYKKAITNFDKSLKEYPEFSEALYYKGYCMKKLGYGNLAFETMQIAKEFGLRGYTINEDNVIYEKYPYQIKWTN